MGGAQELLKSPKSSLVVSLRGFEEFPLEPFMFDKYTSSIEDGDSDQIPGTMWRSLGR